LFYLVRPLAALQLLVPPAVLYLVPQRALA
jgi:hypothetical protein